MKSHRLSRKTIESKILYLKSKSVLTLDDKFKIQKLQQLIDDEEYRRYNAHD